MKYTTKTLRIVDWKELDREIEKYLKDKKLVPATVGKNNYKFEFSCVAAGEWNNDSDHQFDVEPEPLDEYEIRELGLGNISYKTSAILNAMCNDGLIERGEYLVRVSW